MPAGTWPSGGGQCRVLHLAGLLPMLPLVGDSEQEPLQEDAVFVQVLDGESMVRA